MQIPQIVTATPQKRLRSFLVCSLLLSVLWLSFVTCGWSSPSNVSSPPDVSGSYTGTGSYGMQSASVSMNIKNQSGGDINGSIAFLCQGWLCAVDGDPSITGDFTGSVSQSGSVQLKIDSWTFTGTYANKQINGVWQDPPDNKSGTFSVSRQGESS
jgi:hypothetical protein